MLIIVIIVMYVTPMIIASQTMPDLSASTHHFLLANLCLTNVISCTILKPASAVYISYAYAKVVYLKV